MNSEFFGKRSGVRYIPRSVVSPRLGELPDPSETPYYRENRTIFEELTRQYGGLLRSGYIAPVRIRTAGPGLGMGLFAEEDIPPGALIGEYAGMIQKARPLPLFVLPGVSHPNDYAWDYPPAGEGIPPLEVNAFRAGNALRFVNHSFTPLCTAEHTVVDGRWVVFFTACADIAAGRQLTVDYGEEYWTCRQRTLILFGE